MTGQEPHMPIPEELKEKANKIWRDSNFKVTIEEEVFTLKELYDREIEISKKIHEKTKKVTKEQIPMGKYILYVNLVETGTMGSEKIEYIDQDRLKKVYEAETGSGVIDKENFQSKNMSYCLGFDAGDDRFRTMEAFTEEVSSNFNENCVGIVFSGSEVDMKDDKNKEHQKAIKKVVALANQATSLGIPMLGICFGGQMLASTMKAEIDWVMDPENPEERKRVVGLNYVNKTNAENTLLVDLPPKFPGAENHGQEIIEKTLPKNAVILAKSETGTPEIVLCKEDGKFFILCLQFHAEVGPTRLEMVQSGFGVDIAPIEKIFSYEANLAREKIFPIFLTKCGEASKKKIPTSSLVL